MADVELSEADVQFIKELRAAKEEGRISRRDALKVAGALGLGGVVGGAGGASMFGNAAADASTSDSDGNVGLPGDRVDVYADGVDGKSATLDQLSEATYYVGAGESIQTVINNLETDHSGGFVALQANVGAYNETGINVPAGITVVGASADTASTVAANSDQYVFEMQGGRSQLQNIRIECDGVTGYSSNAVQFTDAYNYGRWWHQLVDVTLVGPIGATELSRAINLGSFNGAGISWVTGRGVNIVGFRQGIRSVTATNSDFVSGCYWDGVSIQQTNRGVYEEDNSAGSAEIQGNYYRIGANGSVDITDVIYTEGQKSVFETWLYDMGQVAGSPFNITGKASDIDIRQHVARAAGNISDSGARTRYWGVIGGGPLGGVDLSTTAGQFDGDRAVANGTATGATAFDLAVWDSSLNTGSGGWHVFNADTTV